MKKTYIPPILEIYEYEVERGFAWSDAGDDWIDEPINRNCNCSGWDCGCSRRADCKGSGIDGCHPKGRWSMSDDEEIW